MGKLWTVEELAKAWRVHPKSIYRMIARQDINVTRIGRSVRIPDEQAKKGCDRQKGRNGLNTDESKPN